MDNSLTEAILRLEPMIKETLDRARRSETRLTSFMIEHGMTPPVQKPRMENESGSIVLPSLACSLAGIIRTPTIGGRYRLVHAGRQIGYIDIWEEGVKQATTMPNKGIASDSNA